MAVGSGFELRHWNHCVLSRVSVKIQNSPERKGQKVCKSDGVSHSVRQTVIEMHRETDSKLVSWLVSDFASQ